MRVAKIPIAAPSANISNYISPTKAEHVINAFSEEVYTLDGGSSIYGLESTIIDLSNNKPRLLRYGYITPDLICDLLGVQVDIFNDDKILAPGMSVKHYSPKASFYVSMHHLYSRVR